MTTCGKTAEMRVIMIGGLVILIILILAIAIVASCIKIVPQAQAYVVERLGAYQDTWSVGLHFKVKANAPGILICAETFYDISLRLRYDLDAGRYNCNCQN